MIRRPDVFRDGVVLPDATASELLATGRYNRVPVMVGSNRDENKLFMALDPRYARVIKGIPLWLKDPRQYEREAGYRSAMWKASAVDEPAAAMSRVQGPSVFAYRFDWDELPQILWMDLARTFGAAHGFEIPFVFGHFDLGRLARFLWSEDSLPGRRTLSAAMMSYWAQFAASGDPGRGRAGDLPRWEPWSAGSPEGARFIVLDTPEGGGIRMSPETVSVEGLIARIEADANFEDARERCELLASLVERTPQFTRERYARIASCASADLGTLAGR
jgi:para-nitrobenzyl esterase